MAHEYTHGVLFYLTGGIPYKNATGAINEGYADIFGCLIEKDWVYAEEVLGTILECRDISEPASIRNNKPNPLPTQYHGDYFVSFDSEEDNGGVHTNGSVISHTAYLMNHPEKIDGKMWKEEDGIPFDVLARLWYESMVLGYNGYSDFYNVRLNVLKAATVMTLSNDKVSIIKSAFDEASIMKNSNGNYEVIGRITIADGDTDLSNNFPLEGADVFISVQGKPIKLKTTEDGLFTLKNVPKGTYLIEVSKKGYVTIKQSVIVSSESTSSYNLSIETIVQDKYGDGIAHGVILVSGGVEVEGLTLIVRQGLNNTTQLYEDELKLYTDQHGRYITPPLRPGEYTIQVVDEREGIDDNARYAEVSFNINIESGKDIKVPTKYIYNTNTNNDELWFELSWGSVETGLRARMAGPTEENDRFHYCWGYNDSNDRSFRSFYVTVPQEYDGLYVCAVEDWSVPDYKTSTRLARSGAQVNVYRGNNHLLTFNVPAKEGRLWIVFYYDGKTKEFFAINEMSKAGSSVLDTLPKTLDELLEKYRQ